MSTPLLMPLLVNNPARRWLFLGEKVTFPPNNLLLQMHCKLLLLLRLILLLSHSLACFFLIHTVDIFKKEQEVGKCLYRRRRRRSRARSSLLYCCCIHYASRGICIHAQRVQGSRQAVSIIVSNEHFGRCNHEREEEEKIAAVVAVEFFFVRRSVVGRRRGSAIRTELYLAARGLFYDYDYYRSKKPQKGPAANPLARPNKKKKKKKKKTTTTTTKKRKKKLQYIIIVAGRVLPFSTLWVSEHTHRQRTANAMRVLI